MQMIEIAVLFVSVSFSCLVFGTTELILQVIDGGEWHKGCK